MKDTLKTIVLLVILLGLPLSIFVGHIVSKRSIANNLSENGQLSYATLIRKNRYLTFDVEFNNLYYCVRINATRSLYRNARVGERYFAFIDTVKLNRNKVKNNNYIVVAGQLLPDYLQDIDGELTRIDAMYYNHSK